MKFGVIKQHIRLNLWQPLLVFGASGITDTKAKGYEGCEEFDCDKEFDCDNECECEKS